MVMLRIHQRRVLFFFSVCSSFLLFIFASLLLTTADEVLPGSLLSVFPGTNSPNNTYQFNLVSGVYVSGLGNIYVADRSTSDNNGIGRVVVLSSNGTLLNVFPGSSSPTNTYQFEYMLDICLDTSGNIYVADSETSDNSGYGRVVVLSSTGALLNVFPDNDSPYQFDGVSGVVVDLFGNIYVADQDTIDNSGHGRVVVLSSNGSLLNVFPGNNSLTNTYQFGNVTGVSVDSLGNIYVADYSTNDNGGFGRVVVLASNGTLLDVFPDSSSTINTYQFDYVEDVFVDTSGNVYVADENTSDNGGSGRVVVLSSNGTLLNVFPGSTSPTNTYQFDYLSGVFVDSLGNIYLADEATSDNGGRGRVVVLAGLSSSSSSSSSVSSSIIVDTTLLNTFVDLSIYSDSYNYTNGAHSNLSSTGLQFSLLHGTDNLQYAVNQNLSRAFTLSFMLSASAYPSYFEGASIIIAQNSVSGGSVWGVGLASATVCGVSGGLWFFLGGSSGQILCTPSPLPLSEAVTVTVSFDPIANKAAVYYNAALMASTSFASNTIAAYSISTSNSICVGCGYTFSGLISNVELSYGYLPPAVISNVLLRATLQNTLVDSSAYNDLYATQGTISSGSQGLTFASIHSSSNLQYTLAQAQNTSQAFTLTFNISATAYPTPIGTQGDIIMEQVAAGTSPVTAWGIVFANSTTCGVTGGLWFFIGSNSQGTGVCTPQITLFTWTWITVSFDPVANSALVYYNGTLVARGSFAASVLSSYLATPQPNSLCIGCGYTFSGTINTVTLQYGGTAYVSAISPVSGPTTGGIPLTISGQNFGMAQAAVSVTVAPNNCPISTVNATSIICTLPPGQGEGQAVVVTVGGLSSSVSFSYFPPSISSLSPSVVSPNGTTSVTVQGSNFGVSGMVLVNGQGVVASNWSQAVIIYTHPAGSGVNIPIVVVVASQASSPAYVSYALVLSAPSNTSIIPASCNFTAANGSVLVEVPLSFGGGVPNVTSISSILSALLNISSSQLQVCIINTNSSSNSTGSGRRLLQVVSQNATTSPTPSLASLSLVLPPSFFNNNNHSAAVQSTLLISQVVAAIPAALQATPAGTSQVSVVQLSATVPSSPLSISASSYQNGFSLVSFLAPLSDGGDPVLSYTVFCVVTLTNQTCGNKTLSAAVLNATITGLTNGVNYTFTVVATNAMGSSVPIVSSPTLPAAAPSAAVIDCAHPVSAADVTYVLLTNLLEGTSYALPSLGDAVFYFSPPNSTGDTPITNYTVTVTAAGNQAPTVLFNIPLTNISQGIITQAWSTFTLPVANDFTDWLSSSSSVTVTIVANQQCGYTFSNPTLPAFHLPSTVSSTNKTVLNANNPIQLSSGASLSSSVCSTVNSPVLYYQTNATSNTWNTSYVDSQGHLHSSFTGFSVHSTLLLLTLPTSSGLNVTSLSSLFGGKRLRLEMSCSSSTVSCLEFMIDSPNNNVLTALQANPTDTQLAQQQNYNIQLYAHNAAGIAPAVNYTYSYQASPLCLL